MTETETDPTDLMEIEQWDIDDIEPYQDNPVDHDDDQIDALRDSIRKFGFRNPVVVNEDGTLIAGHARLEAVKRLRGDLHADIDHHNEQDNDLIVESLVSIDDGLVPVLVADELTEQEQDEFRIADNKVFEHSDWDRDSLRFELREIREAVGFNDDEVERLLTVRGGTTSYEPGEVEERRKKLEEKYKKLSDEKRERKRGLSCPHCSETLYLDGDQLRNALRRAAQGQT